MIEILNCSSYGPSVSILAVRFTSELVGSRRTQVAVNEWAVESAAEATGH